MSAYEFIKATASAAGDCVTCVASCGLKWLGIKELEHEIKHALEKEAEKLAKEAAKAGAKFALRTMAKGFAIKNHYSLGECTIECF